MELIPGGNSSRADPRGSFCCGSSGLSNGADPKGGSFCCSSSGLSSGADPGEASVVAVQGSQVELILRKACTVL